jgi:hypothetical protein
MVAVLKKTPQQNSLNIHTTVMIVVPNAVFGVKEFIND